MKVLKRAYFTVVDQLNSLDQVLSEFEQLYQPWIPKKDWLQCQLALAEGFTNAVRHAHKHLSQPSSITIELLLSTEQMEIKIWDYGLPFDLEAFAAKLEKEGRTQLDGGQGIPILKKIANHLSYFRTIDNRNCLLIIKKFSILKPDVH